MSGPDFPSDVVAKKSPPEFPSDQRVRPRREDHYVLEDLPAQERMLWGALAYVFFPIALYKGRWDPFVRFHVRQGAGLLILWVLAWLLAQRLYVQEAPELGAVPLVGLSLLTCEGIYRALCLEKRRVRVIGWLLDRLPLPIKLAE